MIIHRKQEQDDEISPKPKVKLPKVKPKVKLELERSLLNTRRDDENGDGSLGDLVADLDRKICLSDRKTLLTLSKIRMSLK